MADCDWIILCDYAFPAMHGKLCMIGVFDVILATKSPAKHPRLAIGFSVIGEPGETGTIKLEIIAPTAKVIAEAEANFTLPDAGSAQAHLEIPNLVLPEFGRYAIQIDLGDNLPKVAWFTLKQLSA